MFALAHAVSDLRDDALLVVTVISDEEDDHTNAGSPGSPGEPQDWIDASCEIFEPEG